MAKTYLDNQSLDPGSRKYLDAASDEQRAATRQERADDFASRLRSDGDDGGYIDPKTGERS